MGDITIGILEKLDPTRITEEFTKKLMGRIEESKKELEFHCEHCGAARTGFFDPGRRAILNLTCENATGAQTCNSPPTPRPERDPAYYVPGSLVFVEIAEKWRWPAIVEDDPFERATYKTVTTDPEGKETVEAYFISLISPDEGPQVFHGGFFKPEDLSPFSPIELPPDCTDRYKSALEKATEGLALDLGARLEALSFADRSRWLSNAEGGRISPPLTGDMELFSTFRAAEEDLLDANQIPDYINDFVVGKLRELYPPDGPTDEQVMELALRDFPEVGPFFPGTSGASREQLKFQEFIRALGLKPSGAGRSRGKQLYEDPQDESSGAGTSRGEQSTREDPQDQPSRARKPRWKQLYEEPPSPPPRRRSKRRR